MEYQDYYITLRYPDWQAVSRTEDLRCPILPDMRDEAFHEPDAHANATTEWHNSRSTRAGWERADWPQDDFRTYILDAVQSAKIFPSASHPARVHAGTIAYSV